MKFHSIAFQFKYCQRSLLRGIFDELFASPELFVEFSIWKPDSWNRVAIAQASVIKPHSDLAEREVLDLCNWHTHIIFTLKATFLHVDCCILVINLLHVEHIFYDSVFIHWQVEKWHVSLLYWVTAFACFEWIYKRWNTKIINY